MADCSDKKLAAIWVMFVAVRRVERLVRLLADLTVDYSDLEMVAVMDGHSADMKVVLSAAMTVDDLVNYKA